MKSTWPTGFNGGFAGGVVGVLVAFGAVVLACGPLGPFSGGRLSGEVGPAQVGDWGFAQDEEVAQLETRPNDPHSVNTWFVGLEDRLYVPTSMILGPKDPEERAWVAQVMVDPRVRIRLGAQVFDRRAVLVEGAAEYDIVRSALEAKYELDPTERDPERTIWIFRLDPAV
jgi:hypothetical protein